MKPVDHVNPIVPGNWVRRPEDQQRQRDPKKKGRQPDKDQKQRPGQNPDGRTHIIDELA